MQLLHSRKRSVNKQINSKLIAGEQSQMSEALKGNNMSSKAARAICVWPSRNEFLLAQLKVAGVLAIACFGDKWEPSYERNKNHNMTLFWGFHALLLVVSIGTWTHKAPRDPNSSRITFLSRPQTEEWKGWMQFAFIMYHYYRAWSAYNWIRVFVSSYVWMTGFGNFLYFDKKKDFSIERMVSMFLRINYFPLMLSAATKTSLDLYYVVPLHTEGFFMTLITCKLAFELEDRFRMTYWKSRIISLLISLLVHILFFETKAVNSLLYFSDEMHFRFQADKYSAWLGIVCGLLMTKVNEFMSWAYGGESKPFVSWAQRFSGVALIALWYFSFGKLGDKFQYNPVHPYIFIVPLVGYLMIRNSSKYLTECHSWFLEFLGRNTLETYVLQFHLFMNHQVQYIPIVIPGSGAEGETYLRVANMLLCGCIFVTVAVWARKITVSTQNSVTELVKEIRSKYMCNSPASKPTEDAIEDEESKPMIDQNDEQPMKTIEMTQKNLNTT